MLKLGNNAVRAAGFVFLAQVAGSGLSLVLTILLARLLGASDLGLYFVATTMVDIGALFARVGLESSVLRFASVAYDRGGAGELAALYRKSVGLILLAALCIVPLVWVFCHWVPIGGERADDLRDGLWFVLIAVPFVAVATVQSEFYKAVGSPVFGSLLQALCSPIVMLVGCSILFWLGLVTFNNMVRVYAAAAVLYCLVGVVFWMRRIPGVWHLTGNFDGRLLLRASLPLLVVSAANLAMNWTDILVLGIWSDPQQVGIYGICARLAGTTSFVLVAANSVVAPRLAVAFADKNHERLSSLAQRSVFWTSIAVLPLVVVLLAFPALVLQIFGKSFQDGAWAVRILALGQLISVSLGPVGYLLVMTGREKHFRNATVIGALLNLAGNLVLVPFFGIIGAATATAFSLAVMKILAWFWVWRELGINSLGYFTAAGRSCFSR